MEVRIRSPPGLAEVVIAALILPQQGRGEICPAGVPDTVGGAVDLGQQPLQGHSPALLAVYFGGSDQLTTQVGPAHGVGDVQAPVGCEESVTSTVCGVRAISTPESSIAAYPRLAETVYRLS